MSDVEQALQLVSRPKSAHAVNCVWRYALILATLNSLAERIPTDLIVLLVKEKLWTFAQALAYVRRLSDKERRVRALTAMLREELIERAEAKIVREEALALALDVGYRMESFALTDRNMFEVDRRADICRRVWASRLESATAMAGTRKLISEFDRLQIIPILLPELVQYVARPTPGRSYDQETAAINKLELLSSLASHIPAEKMQECVAAARNIANDLDSSGGLYGRSVSGLVAFAEFQYRVTGGKAAVAKLPLRSVTNLIDRAELQIRVAEISGGAENIERFMTQKPLVPLRT